MLISTAFAQTAPAAAGGAESSLLSFLPIILMFVVLYFLMIRPQMKRQKETKAMLESLKTGDEIITAGGLLARITKVGDQYLTIEMGETKDGPVEMLILKGAVQTLLPKDTIRNI